MDDRIGHGKTGTSPPGCCNTKLKNYNCATHSLANVDLIHSRIVGYSRNLTYIVKTARFICFSYICFHVYPVEMPQINSSRAFCESSMLLVGFCWYLYQAHGDTVVIVECASIFWVGSLFGSEL